jgi:hypothetical protein
VIEEQFAEPVGQAETARVILDLWSDPVNVSSLESGDNLVEVDTRHTGAVRFEASGQQEKTVRLSHIGPGFSFDFSFITDQTRTDVRINPNIPIDLQVDSGSGAVSMDLEGLLLTSLSVESGSGSIQVTLPESQGSYEANFDSGSGSLSVQIPQNAALSMMVESGSGSVNVDVPDDAALRIEVQNSGSGSVNLPSGLEQVEEGDGDEEGVWETADYDAAESQIELIFEDVGSGSVNVN